LGAGDFMRAWWIIRWPVWRHNSLRFRGLAAVGALL
jgi:hypothetical protein